MHSIPLPEFTPMLLAAAGATFLLCAGLLIALKGQQDSHSAASAIVSFAIPVGVASFVVLVIASIGSLLLTVGKEPAVPIALGLALIILGVATAMARGSESESQAHH